MPRSILIVDANPGFAGMLRQALAAVGFDCTLAGSAREAAMVASTTHIDLAILDFHLPDASPEDLVRVLRNLRPNILLLGIPPDNDSQSPIIARLGMQGALTKPFYLPDLVPYVAGLLGVEVEAPAEVFPEEGEESELGRIKPPPPKKSNRHIPWLEDSGRAGAWLEQVSAGNPVVACMITRGAELHASTGAISRERLALLARRVAEMWAGASGGTIMQYVKVPPEEDEFFLYSASIALDLDLTLLLDRKTSLTAARRRVQAFQRALGKPPATGSLRGFTAEGGAIKKTTDELTRAKRKQTPDGN